MISPIGVGVICALFQLHFHFLSKDGVMVTAIALKK
jgi:hypothetical protein